MWEQEGRHADVHDRDLRIRHDMKPEAVAAVTARGVELTHHPFPHLVEHLGQRVVLYAEKDRKRITFRSFGPRGDRSKKRIIPKSLGPAGDVPQPVDSGARKSASTASGVLVPALAIQFALKICEQLSDEARGIARDVATRHGKINHVQLGFVFRRVRESAWYGALAPKRADEIERAMRWVAAVLGETGYLDEWDADTVARLMQARTQNGVRVQARDGRPSFLRPASRNTAVKDLMCIGTVFRQARQLKHRPGSKAWLLDIDPLERLTLPAYATRRTRERVDARRYSIMLKHADQVDPSGRFRFALVVARWTGRRISTIRRLQRSSLLTTEEQVRAALARQQCTYVEERDLDHVAQLYATRLGGALYVQADMVKSGQSGDEGRVEQYDAVFPVHPLVIKEGKRYIERSWSKLGLGDDAPLLPGSDLRKSVSKETFHQWWRRAERLAEQAGQPLGMSSGNAWHGFRSNRRTELRAAPAKYARWLIGHSVRTGTPGISVSEGRYLGLVPEDLVDAVLLVPGDG